MGLATGAVVLGLWCTSAREPAPERQEAAPSVAAGSADPLRREADAFAQQALEALRAAGVRGELRYEPEQFRILVPELEGQHGQTLNLGNFFNEYMSRPPEQRSEALQRLVRFSASPPEGPTTYAAARTALLPVIRPRVYFELLSLQEQAGPDDGGVKRGGEFVSWEPLGGVLARALVVDTPEAMRFVNPEQLSKWGVTFEQATAEALANLRRRQNPEDGEGLVPLAPGTCRATWRDSYGSSRMLLDEVWRRCPVRGDPVLLVPNRDVFFVTGSSDEEGLLQVAELALRAYEVPRPVDGRALRRTARGWEPFLPPKGSKPWLAFRKLLVESQRREYDAQTEGLSALHQQRGIDLFVADFTPYEDEHGNTFSQAVWVRGMATLLPKVDMVIFMNAKLGPEAPPVAVVRWEVVERDAGRLLAREEGLYPVRYRLKGFPSDEQLARWKKDPSVMDVP
jgi:hypothetical protein